MSSLDTTIIYYTDNALDPEIAGKCMDLLVHAADGTPIISVSQKPVELGENVCVGDIGRSWLSLYKQLLAGLEAAQTKYVVMAEHDCIYTKEHLSWKPPTDDTFYYNDNCWLLQWKSTKPELDGMFSYWPRRYALSQLICARDLMFRMIDKRLEILDGSRDAERGIQHIVEPGRTYVDLNRVRHWAKSGRCVWLRPMLQAFSDYLETEKEEMFKTKTPNIDIRHGGNFTGPKRGRNRRYDLAPWGTLKDVIERGPV